MNKNVNQILIDYQGQKLSIKEIAELNGLNFQVLTNKYKKIGDINEAVENLKVTQLGPVKYLDFFGQKMTINQIAKMYGIRRETLDYVYKSISDIDEAVSFCINNACEQKIKMQKNTVSIDKLKNLDKSSFPETSLKSNDNTLLNNRQDAIEIAENNVLTEDINKVLQMLPVREEKVLRARYGLDDGYQLDVKEIAKIHGVSTARIRQIEEKALRRLRHPKLSSFLSNYFLLAERIKAERIKLGLDK